MKIIISPAKSLDFETLAPTEKHTQCNFLERSSHLINNLKEFKPSDISTLMKISDKLGVLNYERFQDWQRPFSLNNAKQAVYSFTGDVYKGLDVNTIPLDKLPVLVSKLRILSGLYGILKPLDLIRPYRLEMGTKLAIDSTNNLYQFWGQELLDFLNSELNSDECLVDLASKEYSKAIPKDKLKCKLITPVFKELKGDVYKIIAIHAKRARGIMARFIIMNDISSEEELKSFNENGYAFSESLSNEHELVFTR